MFLSGMKQRSYTQKILTLLLLFLPYYWNLQALSVSAHQETWILLTDLHKRYLSTCWQDLHKCWNVCNLFWCLKIRLQETSTGPAAYPSARKRLTGPGWPRTFTLLWLTIRNELHRHEKTLFLDFVGIISCIILNSPNTFLCLCHKHFLLAAAAYNKRLLQEVQEVAANEHSDQHAKNLWCWVWGCQLSPVTGYSGSFRPLSFILSHH